MPASVTSKLPIEVELVVEVMPCQAMRRSYDSSAAPHPCAYFAEWGAYHGYDYKESGPPEQPSTALPAVYAGKRPVVPELLSGCRKAPIVCVGINPNLPGWTSTSRNAIHPYFDDVLQYAHYFRYRTRDKRRIPDSVYEALLGARPDSPASAQPLEPVGDDIPVEPAPVLMYEQYQTLLDGLAERKNWSGHKLSVGEDIAYANMVACPSTRWVVTLNTDDPDMPVMGQARAKGIVGECFVKRRYFLRQLVQSLPAVIIVFSQTTAREFIAALRSRFSRGNPQPGESLEQLFQREIRLRYGTLSDGTELDARVIFMPHASARPEEFAQMRGPCIDRLVEEVDRGNLIFNLDSGHLRRGRGGCVFCSNALYTIGNCDYLQEFSPLAPGTVPPLAVAESAPPAPDGEKREQLRLLDSLLETAPAAALAAAPVAAAPPPPVVLRGKVVTMAGPVIAAGAVYLSQGDIVAVQDAQQPPPAGFAAAPVIDTGGVIYPGLLDLHNHLAYNILPLWKVPRRFDNRSQWLSRADYRRDVGEPMETLTGAGPDMLKAIIRYIEVKLLLGGVTSGQGMKSKFGGNQLYRGLIRNFEVPDAPGLPVAGSHVVDLKADEVATFRADLDTGRPMFFHLAEGIDVHARQQYKLLAENALLRSNLIGIHSLALLPAQRRKMAQAGSRVVWSPLSNSLLYGKTIDPRQLADSQVVFGLGSDWTPSGSRNLLFELKVAWLTSQHADGVFDFRRLAEAATRSAARVCAWDVRLGTVEAGKLGDLLVLENRVADPFENLVRATEREVRMVIIGGQLRYGDSAAFAPLQLPAGDLEPIQVGGRPRQLYLKQEGSLLSGLTFAAARQRLEAAMSDLAAVRAAPHPLLAALSGEPELEIELDMQPTAMAFALAAALPPLASVTLDAPTVIDDPGYFDALEAIEHLPAFLTGASGLRRFYS